MTIPFSCPHCGVFTEVADEFAGQTGDCASCLKPITVPNSVPWSDARPGRLQRWSHWWVAVLSLLAILGLGAALFTLVFVAAFQPSSLPLIGKAAPPPPACQNNLQRIGQAMQAYLKAKGHFPPAVVTDDDGQPMHSWRVLLLPYLGEDKLFASYDLTQPWDSPVNQRVARRMPDVYGCPSDANSRRDETSYMVVTGPTLLFHQDQSRRPEEVTDRLADTLLAVEVTGLGVHWLQPQDLDGTAMDWRVNLDSGIGSRHGAGGLHVLMANGEVHHLGDFVPQEELQAMATINGNEPVDPTTWSE